MPQMLAEFRQPIICENLRNLREISCFTVFFRTTSVLFAIDVNNYVLKCIKKL